MINVDIVNLSLQAIGVSPIASLDEEVEQARRAKQIYDSILYSALSMHRWNFALKYAPLAQLMVNNLSEIYSYAYQLPSDIIKIVNITNSNGSSVRYINQEGKVYCNNDSAYILYIYKNKDANTYPPYFVDYLRDKLASELSIALTGRVDFANMFYNKADLSLRKAKALDAKQGTPPDDIFISKWLEGRYVL